MIENSKNPRSNSTNRVRQAQLDESHPISDDAVDDDRHIKDPDEFNSTNGPAEFITRIPSFAPTVLSSTGPSDTPSLVPSTSLAPSVSLPCSDHNPFNFGITKPKGSHGNFTESLVQYDYDITSNEDIASAMGQTLIHQVKEVEIALLNLLTKIYFPECLLEDESVLDGDDDEKSDDDDNNNVIFVAPTSTSTPTHQKLHHNIFQPIVDSSNAQTEQSKRLHYRTILHNTTNTTTTSNTTLNESEQYYNISKLIGMSSKPFDVATGGTYSSIHLYFFLRCFTSAYSHARCFLFSCNTRNL